MPLTKAQKQEIEIRAFETVMEDVTNDRGYLSDVVTHYVNSFPVAEQVKLICADRAGQSELFDFDPRTGQPWTEEE